MRRYALRDDQWERIKDLLPGREGHVGVTAKNNRLFVEAVLYRYRAGIPWRDLPERFGDPIKIHTRFSRWAESETWKKVFEVLAADACSIRPCCARSLGPGRLFLGPGTVLVRAHNGAVDHGVFIVRIGSQNLEHLLPHLTLGPAGEPCVNLYRIAEAFRQVPPENACAISVHRSVI